MTALQVVAFLAVAATGTAVALVRTPLRQLVATGFFGLALALLFFILGAPDVALSAIVVGTIAVPVMALLALARMP